MPNFTLDPKATFTKKSLDDLIKFAELKYELSQNEIFEISSLSPLSDPFIDIRRLTTIFSLGHAGEITILSKSWFNFKAPEQALLDIKGLHYRSVKNLLFTLKLLIRSERDNMTLGRFIVDSMNVSTPSAPFGFTLSESKNYIAFVDTYTDTMLCWVSVTIQSNQKNRSNNNVLSQRR